MAFAERDDIGRAKAKSAKCLLTAAEHLLSRRHIRPAIYLSLPPLAFPLSISSPCFLFISPYLLFPAHRDRLPESWDGSIFIACLAK